LAPVVQGDRRNDVDVAIVGVGDPHAAVLADELVLKGVATFERSADLLQIEFGVVVPVGVVLEVQQYVGVEFVVVANRIDDCLVCP